MTHLGDRVSAYVDGQLPLGLTERVTGHLVECPPCRAAVERERRVKHALTAMAPPAPGIDFLSSLVALGGPVGPVAPRPGHVPGNPRPPLVMFEADVRRDPTLSLAPSGPVARAGLRRRWGGALVGAVTVVGAGMLSATLLPMTGGGAGTLVRPPSGQLVVTPGSPLVPQNVVRRFGGARSTSGPTTGAPASFGPVSPAASAGAGWSVLGGSRSSATPLAVAWR